MSAILHTLVPVRLNAAGFLPVQLVLFLWSNHEPPFSAGRVGRFSGRSVVENRLLFWEELYAIPINFSSGSVDKGRRAPGSCR